MQTLKIQYKTNNDGTCVVKEYRKQYSSLLRSAFNRAIEGCTEKSITDYLCGINGFGLMDSYFTRCAVKESIQLVKTCDEHTIFGGKKNFLLRAKGKISQDEFRDRRLSPLYSLGEANQKANRKFKLSQSCDTITFQPCRNKHITLEIVGTFKNYKKLLAKLYAYQESKELPISYHLDDKYIYISFDEKAVSDLSDKVKKIDNRIFAIDLNPNYVGWSVVDWKSSGDFRLIDSGVISIKSLNDKEFAMKQQRLSSDSKERVHISNKRKHEVFEICRNLVDKALHYQCKIFAMEELNIKSNDKDRGKRFNRLCNNMWNRNKMVDNLKKRCNIYGIRVIEVKPEYSSFVGNFLYRDLRKPDMVLSSIEIGRRGYEFNAQYIEKVKEIKKNIVTPMVCDFVDRYAKSMEEFGVEEEVSDLRELYYKLKKSKCRYRLSIEENSSGFSRLFSKTSLILKIY